MLAPVSPGIAGNRKYRAHRYYTEVELGDGRRSTVGTGDERQDWKGQLGELLAELAGLDGVAGHEHAVVARLRELFVPASEDVTIDSFGNLFARINAEGTGKISSTDSARTWAAECRILARSISSGLSIGA